MSYPHDLAAESAVISCLLQWPTETAPILREEQITGEWFFGTAATFDRLTQMVADGRTLDIVTVSAVLRDAGLLDGLGVTDGEHRYTGIGALSRLFTLLPGGGMLSGYLDILREKFLARRLLAIATHITETVTQDATNSGLALVKTASSSVAELASYGVRCDTIRQIRPFIVSAVEAVQAAFHARGNTLGLSWGIASMDRMTRGIRKRFGYYIAGRPAAGKSAFMGDVIDFIGTNPDPFSAAAALVFSIEMTGEQLVSRSVMKRAGISQQRVRDGLMSEARDFPKLMAAAGELAKARVHIDETATLTIDDIAARTRRFVRKHRALETDAQREAREKSERPDIVLAIDYLQRVKGTSKRAQQNRYLEVAEVTQGISSLLKELGIAGLIVVQLGRADNEGPDKFPSLSDMRESGDIEAEAHVVIAMHRPVYYLPTSEKKRSLRHQEKPDRRRKKHTRRARSGAPRLRVHPKTARGADRKRPRPLRADPRPIHRMERRRNHLLDRQK